MKRFLTGLFTLFTAAFLFAQTVVIIPGRVIRMNVPEADKDSIKLSELSVNAEVTGNIAITTFEMVFTNSSGRVLEGNFEFPLDEGQTVCGFALDVNNKMREGVVVEKEKGRVVFEDIVRRGIDPGLVEVTAGNNFKTRVYPLPAHGSRRVRISIQQELSKVDGKNYYILNPITDETLKSFSFKFTDFGNDEPKTQNVNGYDFTKASTAVFTPKGDFDWKNPIKMEVSDNKTGNAPKVFIETKGTDTWFYSPIPVEAKTQPKAKINNLGVYFDVSLSAKNRNLDAELAVLKDYISSNVKKSVEVVAFSNEVISKQTFKPAEIEKLEAYIRGFVYDGGTSLSVLPEDSKNYDEILLLSDGLENWGQKKSLSAKCPVSVITSSYSADFNALKKVARDNGGSFVNLNQQSKEQALNSLKNEALRLIKVEYDADKIQEIYPATGSSVDENFSLSGLLKKKEGVVKVSFGYGNRILSTQTINVSAVTGVEANNVSRFWAQKKIDELSMDYDVNRSEILELGKAFTIVTKETSLIVLENISDYVRYGITPPEELKAEYDKYISRTSSGTAKASQNKGSIPDYVYTKWEEHKKWWNSKPGEYKEEYKRPLLNVRNLTNATSSERADGRIVTASSRASAARDDIEYDDVMEMQESAPMTKSASGSGNSNTAKITIQPWNPDVKYLKTLKKTPTAQMYVKYLELRNEYEGSPSFYMDVATYFMEDGLKTEAIRILSNLAELNLDDSDVLRALGNKLVEFGEYDKAITVFEKLVETRSEIPQFYRDAALCYEKLGEYQKAADTLYKVINRDWDSRFREVQLICLNDLNALIATSKDINTSAYDSKLIENLPVDMRVILTWNTDNCDIDLWVTDPNNEKCFYANNYTALGGKISRDFTRGYGPEEFVIKEAKAGKYKIQAHYYGSSSQKILQPVVVQAEVYTHFGTPQQKCEILTLELKTINGDFTIGEVSYQ